MNTYVKTDEDVIKELRAQVSTLTKERDEVIYASIAESSMLRDRIHSLEVERDALKKDLALKDEWVKEWKRVAESLKSCQPSVLSLTSRIHSLEEGVRCAVEALGDSTLLLKDGDYGNCECGFLGGRTCILCRKNIQVQLNEESISALKPLIKEDR